MKSMFRTTRLVLATGLALGAATVLAEGAAPSSFEQVQAKVYELLDRDITSIKFAKGSDALTAGERETLRAFVTAAKNNGKIDKFIVASWADQEMPRGDKKLSDKQRHLADDRTHAVKQALSEAGAASVEGFSMAERANWIQKTFNTEVAQLKGGGKVTSADDRITAQIGERLRAKGGPGTSVIVVKYEPNPAAH